jgi:RNA polymerase sigma factor (TIGR02999 family)
MSEVTRILSAIENGDLNASEQLLPLVYDELRKLAAHLMAGEGPAHTLQATALVHEAFLRLIGADQSLTWEGRRHFFGSAAEAMRRILIEAARRKRRLRHGGGRAFQELLENDVASPEKSDLLLNVAEALDQLAVANAQAAELVKLRYFAGCTNLETATLMGISARKANQIWAYARAWLLEAMDAGAKT